MSALPKNEQRRFTSRYRLTGEIPGSLTTRGGVRIHARTVDVSLRGLGLIAGHLLPAGQLLTLDTKWGAVTLEVVYCQPYLGLENLFRVGLFARDPDCDLAAIFDQAGLISGEESDD